MAMAEVFLPEIAGSDDHLNGSYPRAPPPSPEMQPRNHGRVFEFSPSKLEGIGIGLDLRRNTFPLDEEDESPLLGSRRHMGGVAMGYDEEAKKVSPSHLRGFDDEDDSILPGSPLKKVCCSPRTLPNELTTTVFPSSSNQDSIVSSGFGSYQLPPLHISTGGSGTGFRSNPGSQSGSDSPYIRSSKLCPQTSPQFVAGAVQGSADPFTPYSASMHQDLTVLSRSYDLHSMHPHLPRSFETTQLPEVRPSRSRTLDSTQHPLLSLGPDAMGTDDARDSSHRQRKISIKRKNPDEEDPSLQFSFEYSYSSTGSGEADWVMVDCKMESSWPTGKKACCADDPSSVAISHQNELQTSPLHGTPLSSFSPNGVGGSGGLFVPSRLTPLNPTPLSTTITSTGFSPFANIATTTSPFTGQQVGVSFDRVETPTNIYNTNLDSEAMMDCDVMDCEQIGPKPSPFGESGCAASGFGGVVSGHLMQVDGGLLGAEEAGVAVMRSHLGPSPSSALRHSCVDEYLHSGEPGCKGQGWTGDGMEAFQNGGDLDMTKLNLSKSL